VKIAGQSLVIPLIDTKLRYSNSIELIHGVIIKRLTPEYRERLKKEKALLAVYESSLGSMSVGLSLEPSILYPNRQLSLIDSLLAGIFLSFALRLATDVPIDIPFWFDVSSDGQILELGQTRVRTFRNTNRYRYLLDEGSTFKNVEILRSSASKLLECYFENPDSDRIIKAIEFASIGFQTRHIPTRLVNQVMFMEILFSSDVHELSFQLASRISWYLRYCHTSAEREELFLAIKDIYAMRSKIVHGVSSKNQKNLRSQMRKLLIESETVNSEIFREILALKHIELFSSKNREENLRKLSLGLPCDFMKKC
jgi:hypothetical protein